MNTSITSPRRLRDMAARQEGTGAPTEEELSRMTKRQLMDLCRERGMCPGYDAATKATLVRYVAETLHARDREAGGQA